MKERPSALEWTGATLPDGRPLEWYADIPARDLDADDLARLTDEQVERALHSRLYRAPRPAKTQAEKE